jgi:hypothetical protein
MGQNSLFAEKLNKPMLIDELSENLLETLQQDPLLVEYLYFGFGAMAGDAGDYNRHFNPLFKRFFPEDKNCFIDNKTTPKLPKTHPMKPSFPPKTTKPTTDEITKLLSQVMKNQLEQDGEKVVNESNLSRSK